MSVNHVIFVGFLGKDPDLRFTASGTPVANFSLATSERIKDKNGQTLEKTEWHQIVVWRQLAEICGKYLAKGSQIYMEGRIQYRSYEDRDGIKRNATEIVMDKLQMLGRSRSESGGEAKGGPLPTEGQPRIQGEFGGYDDPGFNSDDDVPF